MINPGGSPGTSFTKSAQTRFNNGQINGARATMPLNAAAQQSVRNMKSGTRKSTPPVGSPTPSAANMLPTGGQAPAPVGNVNPQPQPQINPEDIAKGVVDDVVSAVRREQFINSPQVKDAMTSIRLRNIFNATNPDAAPDTRGLMGRVSARIKG